VLRAVASTADDARAGRREGGTAGGRGAPAHENLSLGDHEKAGRRAWSILLRAMLDGQREGRIAARERAWERRRPSLGAQIDRLMERASRRRA
jgi:hypothetical protein